MGKENRSLMKKLREFSKKLPKFEDGRIDYTNSDSAPGLNVFLEHEGKILIMKRSNKVGAYRKTWEA
jgi:hypothetical protein